MKTQQLEKEALIRENEQLRARLQAVAATNDDKKSDNKTNGDEMCVAFATLAISTQAIGSGQGQDNGGACGKAMAKSRVSQLKNWLTRPTRLLAKMLNNKNRAATIAPECKVEPAPVLVFSDEMQLYKSSATLVVKLTPAQLQEINKR